MKLLLAALGIAILAGAPAQAAVHYFDPISGHFVFFDDDDGYTEPSGGEESGSEPANPCAPESYDPNECITPE